MAVGRSRNRTVAFHSPHQSFCKLLPIFFYLFFPWGCGSRPISMHWPPTTYSMRATLDFCRSLYGAINQFFPSSEFPPLDASPAADQRSDLSKWQLEPLKAATLAALHLRSFHRCSVMRPILPAIMCQCNLPQTPPMSLLLQR